MSTPGLGSHRYRTSTGDLIHRRPPGMAEKQVSTHSDTLHLGQLHKDFVSIHPHCTYELPEVTDGPGVVTSLWLTFTPLKLIDLLKFRGLSGLDSTILRVYFDGEAEPRIQTPIGDYFGAGFGAYRDRSARAELVGMTSGGFYSYFPMPFKKSVRVSIENTSDRTINAFYGQMSYLTIPDLPEDTLYFNAAYKKQEMDGHEHVPYVVLDVNDGPGHYVGVMLSQRQHGIQLLRIHLPVIRVTFPTRYSFLEGNVRFYVDGEREPSFESTGNEDYFMGGWYYNKGEFSHLHHGVTYKRGKRITSYRFHPSGVPYQQQMRITVNVGERNEVRALYKSVTYWYSA